MTAEDERRGLMYRTSLPPAGGMLFMNEAPRPMQMWMKNTLIPLDMLFFAGDGHIVNIIENAEPQTLTIRPSDGPVMGSLELAGGTAKRLGIAPGDVIRHQVLHNLDQPH